MLFEGVVVRKQKVETKCYGLSTQTKKRRVSHATETHISAYKDGFDWVTQDTEIQLVVTKNFEVDAFVKGYHAYKNIWIPKIGETLSTEREPCNLVDKYAFCVKKKDTIVGYLLEKIESLRKLYCIF